MLGWQTAGLSLAAALALFLLLLLAAMRGALGGGDVKLAAAMATGLSPAATWDFVFATVMIGGLLGLIYLAGPHIAPRLRPIAGAPLLRRILTVEAWRLRRRGPVPYGVAIAGGGIFVLLGLPGP
jgi:prepilin peptidase CpaA